MTIHRRFPRGEAGRAPSDWARQLGTALTVGFLCGVASPAPAQREPVLKQVALPHPYYWREMYVPQLTSGPSAVTWSPGGTELIYSMQGTLWRQRIGAAVARQLTSGQALDYQPDWSPDGRFVAFARYADDAIELELLDVASGSVRPITANHAVNLEPRWSPDGTRIAFVSSSYNGRWHIFTVAVEDGAPGAIVRLTEDNDSKLPRYYYSTWDHYISPTWSPDGREIMFVSNRGHLHGTGGFWRMEARPGAAAREIRYEETTWKARPDWAPDGRRVVYSSYLGRQWHQLWLMTSDGGDPFPLTYGEFDATAPRWSRDGKRIAYISNDGGNTSLWIIDVPGARTERVAVARRRYREPMGRLRLVITDRAGHALPARVSVSPALPALPALTGGAMPGGAMPGGAMPGGAMPAPPDGLGQRRPDGLGQPRPYGLGQPRPYGRGDDRGLGQPRPYGRGDVRGLGQPRPYGRGDVRGRAYAPDDAWVHADEAFDRSERRFEYGYFHAAGAAEVMVPAGPVMVEVWHGPEYRVARAEVMVPAGSTVLRRVILERLADLPAQGWWSGDLHVHMNYGGAYRNTPGRLAFQARAEDLHVVLNLIVNKEQRIPDIAYFRTDPDPASGPGLLLLHGQEFHTSYWGHIGFLGLRDHYILPEYAGYPNTAAASLFPTNAAVADLAHAQGALVGYVHPFDTAPDPADTTEPLTSELPADVALGKVDYIEVMGYSDHLITSQVWYRLLNCGFRIAAGAGTDAFPNFASLRGPPGLERVFVRTGPRLDRRRWLEGLKRGRTFVTNAPLLQFTLGGREVGDEIRLPAGTHRLTARVNLRSSVPIDHLEIVGNGTVVAAVALAGDHTFASDTVSIPIAQSGWYVLRAYRDRAEEPILDRYPFGSTSPIYVRVGDGPVRSPEDAAFFVRWIDRLDGAVRASPALTGGVINPAPTGAVNPPLTGSVNPALTGGVMGWNSAGEREAVLDMLARARAVYAGLAR